MDFEREDQHPMKLHRPIAQTVVAGLIEIFTNGRNADKVIERALKSRREFGARDRRFIAEGIYEIVRWWRLLWAAADAEPTLESTAIWKIFGTWLALTREDPLPAWSEFAGIDSEAVRARASKAKESPAVRESVPDWLYERGLAEIGSEWNVYLNELNKSAPVILRTNTLRLSRDQLRTVLAAQGIESEPAPPAADALRLIERKNVFKTEAFKKGLFELQDGASQQVAPLLDPQPGDRVIDACAGAGGKSLHMAALMRNKGKILALDVHERRLGELRKRAARDGVDIIETRLIDSSKMIKRLEESADRLLLDVPCSGTGILRRNPDAKWKLSHAAIEEMRRLQAQILDSYTRMLKTGGRLVYATCSCLPSENERQVSAFLEREDGKFTLLEEIKFPPGKNGFDGFYAASLIKRDH